MSESGSRTVRIAQLGLRRATDFSPGSGREPDLGRLVEALRHFPALAVTGPHGIGKSTLASMALGHFTTNPDSFGLIAWLGVRGDEGFSEVAARIFGLVGGGEPSVSAFAKKSELEQADATLELLRTRSVFLVLDGLELATDRRSRTPRDLGFARFMGGLRGELGDTRLLMTTRDGYTAEGAPGPERFVVGGLAPAAGAELLRNAGLEDAEDVRREASERAGGLPRGLQLLARLCLHGGARSLRGYVVDPKFWGASPEESAVKLAEQVVLRTVDGDDRRVLLAAGLLHGVVDSATLAAATELEAGDVTTRARALARAGLLTETAHGWFMDSLVRAAVAPKVRAAKAAYKRIEQHAATRVPRALGAGWDVEDLRPALTMLEAPAATGEWERVVEGLVKRGVVEALVARGFVARAFALCEAALAAVDQAAAAAQATLAAGATQPPAGSGTAPQPIPTLTPEQTLSLLRVMVDLCGRLGRDRTGVALGVRALQLAEQLDDARTAGEIYVSMGHMYLGAGELAYALDAFERAAAAGREGQDARLASAAWIGAGRTQQQKGDLAAAARAFDEAAQDAAAGGDRVGRGVALLYGASARESAGAHREALQLAEEALRLLTQARSPHAQRAQGLVHALRTRVG